jgi:transposase
MGQTGFFNLENRLKVLDEMKNPLKTLNQVVPWEDFRSMLRNKKNEVGRKPYDEVLMFKILVLEALYNLADERTQFYIQDRLSFMRFLGLGMDGMSRTRRLFGCTTTSWRKAVGLTHCSRSSTGTWTRLD